MSQIIQPASTQLVQDVVGENAIRMSTLINNDFNFVNRSITQLFNDVWSNGKGLTPQQVMDSFGANAAQLFSLMNAAITFLNSVQAGTWVTPIPYNYTINPDGTVTIGSLIGS